MISDGDLPYIDIEREGISSSSWDPVVSRPIPGTQGYGEGDHGISLGSTKWATCEEGWDIVQR